MRSFSEPPTRCCGVPRLILSIGEATADRESFGKVVLAGRLREAIRRLNPAIHEEAQEEALRKVLRVGTPALVQTNRAFHPMLTVSTSPGSVPHGIQS